MYLWSIEHRGAYLASYPGQCVKGASNFDKRIWQEFKWWESGKDCPVDIEKWKRGERIELPKPPPPGHTEREVAELKPLIRLWLMPLQTQDECNQAEKWLVADLCKHPLTRQFLANRNPEGYRPDSTWPVRIEAPASFRLIGLTVPATAI